MSPLVAQSGHLDTLNKLIVRHQPVIDKTPKITSGGPSRSDVRGTRRKIVRGSSYNNGAARPARWRANRLRISPSHPSWRRPGLCHCFSPQCLAFPACQSPQLIQAKSQAPHSHRFRGAAKVSPRLKTFAAIESDVVRVAWSFPPRSSLAWSPALEVNGNTGPTSGLALADPDFGVGSGPGSATGAT